MSAAEPAASWEPPLKRTNPATGWTCERCQRQRRTRHRIDFAAFIFTDPRAENDGACQSAQRQPSAQWSNRRNRRNRLQRPTAAAPFPGALDRVDDAGQHDHENQERPQANAFRQRARHDGCGGRHEDHLEEPVGWCRISGVRIGCDIAVIADRSAVVRSPRGERTDPAAIIADACIHKIIADNEIHKASNGIKRNVLQADRRNVLWANHAGFEHAKARGHEHDKETADKEQQRIEDIGRLTDRCCFFLCATAACTRPAPTPAPAPSRTCPSTAPHRRPPSSGEGRGSKINGTPKGVYLPISKLLSILAVANLVAHNNKSQICYCGQI